MKSRKRTAAAKPARTPHKGRSAYKLTPAEREVEAIRERRRTLWRELGSLEAVEALGRKVREERSTAKKTSRRRSA
jgi:hypothetical protein